MNKNTYFSQLYDVEEGFKIVVHWKSHLKFVTQIYHSTSSGDPLVHLSDDSLFEKSFLALSYNRNKPWVRSSYTFFLKKTRQTNASKVKFCHHFRGAS